MNNGFVYDEETRNHRDDRGPIFSVTQVLTIEGCYKGADFFNEEGLIIGSYLHKTIEYYNKGTLNEEELDPVLQRGLSSWKAWCEITGFQPLVSEQPFYHPILRYCGKVDVFGYDKEDRFVLPDIKHGNEQPCDALQLAGYELMLLQSEYAQLIAEKGGVKRCSLYLDLEHGRLPKQNIHNKRTDISVFTGMLSSVYWKRSEGLI